MPTFLVELFILIGVIWLTQVLLDALEIKEPAHKIIFVGVVLIGIIWLIMGKIV